MADNMTADGNNSFGSFPPSLVNFTVTGSFGGGTAKLQLLPDAGDGSTWVDVGSDTSFTSAGAGNARVPACQLRANLNGSTSPDIDVSVQVIEDFARP